MVKKGEKLSKNHKKKISKAVKAMLKCGNIIVGKNALNKRKQQEENAGRKRPKRCEICGEFTQICFDHDHKTGQFRGWICNRCNVILGFAKDSPELLRRLADYLES